MPKELLKKELIYINLKKDEYRFYNIEVLSVGFNQLQVITNFGRLGTKGKESIYRIDEGESPYKEAMKFAYKKIFDKKSEGYINRERIASALVDAAKKGEYPKKNFKSAEYKVKKECACDLCKKKMDEDIYQKINTWARGEGNWDYDKNFIGYKKVLCLNCQIEKDLFQKVAGKKN